MAVIQAVSYTSSMTPVGSTRRAPHAKPLTVRLDPALERRLQVAATQEGMSISAFVRAAITDRLNRGPSDATLWDAIAPSVVTPGTGRSAGRRAARQPSTHAAFVAGVEAKAAKKWRRLDA